MQELWRKSAELFREHPVLWLPYICAELCTVTLSWVMKVATRAIIHWFLTSHSVLGGEYQVPMYDAAARHKALLLAAPVENGIHFANVCLLVSAFVMTARLAEAILDGRTPSIPIALRSLRAYSRRILWFSLKFCVCMVVVTLLAFSPLALIRDHLHMDPQNTGTMIWSVALLVTLAVAWVVTPMALKLLDAPASAAIDSKGLRWARRFAMLTAAAIAILGYLYKMAPAKMRIDSALEGTGIGYVASVAINFPLVLLFLALALLAFRQVQAPDILAAQEPDDLPPA